MNTSEKDYQSSISWFLSGVDGSVPSVEDNAHLARVLERMSALVQKLAAQDSGISQETKNTLAQQSLQLGALRLDPSIKWPFELRQLLPMIRLLTDAIHTRSMPTVEQTQADSDLRAVFAELILLAKYSRRADFAEEILQLLREKFPQVAAAVGA